MIAYNHLIKFEPPLNNGKCVSSKYSNVLKVRQRVVPDNQAELPFKLKFFNNQGRDIVLYTDRPFANSEAGQLWVLDVVGVARFCWRGQQRLVEYSPQAHFSSELLEYWSLQIVLPLYFTIESIFTFLHAGAVALKGRNIMFVAESFGGKSTLTDYFLQQGHRLLSDDKVATYLQSGKVFAVPSHPHHRPYRKMEDLGFYVEHMVAEPGPVHAIYCLEKGEANTKVSITALQGVERFSVLGLANEMKMFFQHVQRFEYLAKVASITPVFRLVLPWNMNRLNDVYAAICKHSHGL